MDGHLSFDLCRKRDCSFSERAFLVASTDPNSRTPCWETILKPLEHSKHTHDDSHNSDSSPDGVFKVNEGLYISLWINCHLSVVCPFLVHEERKHYIWLVPWGCHQAVLELGPSEVSPCWPTPVYGTQVISVTFIHTWRQVMSNANLIQNSFIFSFCWRAAFQASSLRSAVSLLNHQLHFPTNSTRPTFPPVAQLSQRHQQTATPRCSDFQLREWEQKVQKKHYRKIALLFKKNCDLLHKIVPSKKGERMFLL